MKIIFFVILCCFGISALGVDNNYTKYQYTIADRAGNIYSLDREVALYRDEKIGESYFFHRLARNKSSTWKHVDTVVCGYGPDDECPKPYPFISP